MGTKTLLDEALRKKLDQLRGLPYSALVALPQPLREDIPGLTRANLQVWVEPESDDALKVIVKVSKSYGLGIGLSKFGGFRTDKVGGFSNLGDNELE